MNVARMVKVEELALSADAARRGEPVEVTARVVNDGGEADEQSVRLFVRDSMVAEEPVALEPDEEMTVSLAVDTGTLPAGEHEFTLYTDDVAERGTLTVAEATTDQEADVRHPGFGVVVGLLSAAADGVLHRRRGRR